MRSIGYVVTVVGLLCGCKSAVVISADGTTELGYCSGEMVSVCVPGFCPNGAFTLRGADKVGGDAVIRCISQDGGQ